MVIAKNLKENLMITFDFDETLTMPTWNRKYRLLEPSETLNQAAIALLLDYHQQGEELAIVTTRWRDDEVLAFVEQHQLPIAQVCLTEGELKHQKLCLLGCKLHYDDSEAEAIANQKAGIPTVLVSYRFCELENRVICHFSDSGVWRTSQAGTSL